MVVLRRSTVVQMASEFANYAKTLLKTIKVYIYERKMSNLAIKMLDEHLSKVKTVPNIQSMQYIQEIKLAVAELEITCLREKSRVNLIKLEEKCETSDTLQVMVILRNLLQHHIKRNKVNLSKLK